MPLLVIHNQDRNTYETEWCSGESEMLELVSQVRGSYRFDKETCWVVTIAKLPKEGSR